MDDMQTFEHRVAAEMLRRAGPSLPVDDFAIYTAVTSRTAGPSRLPSLFSATRFVVAGAVVALLGGFLLAGVTTTPRGGALPGAGASASASPAALAAAPQVATDDALWDARYRTLGTARIDAATGEVTIIPTPSETALLLPTDDAIWAFGSDGVHRVDRASLAVTDSIDVAGGPAVIADGSLWLWSLGSDDSSLVEIDLETRAIGGEYPMDGDSPIGRSYEDWSQRADSSWISVVDGAIWMHGFASEGHVLRGFDPATREFTDRISLDEPAEDDGWPCCMAVDDAIWLRGPGDEGTLTRFDVATLEVTDTLEFGPGLGGGIAAAGAIWMNGGGSIHRIDPVTREIKDIAVTNYRNRPPAYGDGAVWVGTPGGLSRIDVDSLEVTTICHSDCEMESPPIVSNGVAWTFRDGGPIIRVDAVTGARRWQR